VLIECEPAIKSIIVHLDSVNHDFIIEDLDENRLVVKENMVELLKEKLNDVSPPPVTITSHCIGMGC
jgi:TFIIH basal transcription factor complex TTD-A subunit